jgi:glycosyltransferase involved in cell wall biosynthesis
MMPRRGRQRQNLILRFSEKRFIFRRHEPRPLRHHPGGGLKISVVVPAFNEEKLVGASLVSIREAMTAFDARGWTGELIVCDNNSTDRTAELARAAGATVVFEPVNQIGRARNTGAAAASGDWLIFVDADSHPNRGLFAEVADAIQTGKYVFGGAKVKMEGSHPVANFSAMVWNAISRLGKFVAGSFIFCETTAFREIGGFNNRMYAAEEIDLANRLKVVARQRGKKVIVLHRHPLITSDRKVRLYSKKELLTFLLRATFSHRRTLTDRDACHSWYDGRR